jgi:hypothetical protein
MRADTDLPTWIYIVIILPIWKRSAPQAGRDTTGLSGAPYDKRGWISSRLEGIAPWIQMPPG